MLDYSSTCRNYLLLLVSGVISALVLLCFTFGCSSNLIDEGQIENTLLMKENKQISFTFQFNNWRIESLTKPGDVGDGTKHGIRYLLE